MSALSLRSFYLPQRVNVTLGTLIPDGTDYTFFESVLAKGVWLITGCVYTSSSALIQEVYISATSSGASSTKDTLFGLSNVANPYIVDGYFPFSLVYTSDGVVAPDISILVETVGNVAFQVGSTPTIQLQRLS